MYIYVSRDDLEQQSVCTISCDGVMTMLRTHIMYHRSCGVTARAIYSALQDIIGDNVSISSGPPDTRNCNVIRWGTSARGRRVNGVIFNPRRAILNVTDKYKTLEILADDDRLVWHTPNFSKDPSDIFHDGRAIIWRGRNHRHGNQWEYIEDLSRATHNRSGDGYFMEYINKVREYRIYASPDKAMVVYEKIPSVENPDPYRWNMDFGYRQEQVKDITMNTIVAIRIAMETVSALHLNFGAVDVVETEGGRLYVLECNSAPTLGEYSLPIITSHMVNTIWPNGIENDGDVNE